MKPNLKTSAKTANHWLKGGFFVCGLSFIFEHSIWCWPAINQIVFNTFDDRYIALPLATHRDGRAQHLADDGRGVIRAETECLQGKFKIFNNQYKHHCMFDHAIHDTSCGLCC